MPELKQIVLPSPSSGSNFDNIDPLDSRYYNEIIAKYLSERSRIAYYAYIEAALVHTLADYGICSRRHALEIESACRNVTAEDVYKEEIVTNHHTKALVNAIKNRISKSAQPYVHFGATSFDIISTAEALQFKSVAQEVVIPELKKTIQTLLKLSYKYKDTLQIGRTHGQHAVPITFGYALAEYVSRLGSSTQAIEALSSELKGKFSGAVGAYNALHLFVKDPMAFEKTLLHKVGLEPSEYSTQITPPEALIRLLDEMAIAGGIMANLAHDMRHLQRTEIAEVQEKFEPGQTGSSTMAHKRNPWNFENIISMNKQLQAQMLNANLNIASEHQRDLTDSASSRFYSLAPALLTAMSKRLNSCMSKIEVNQAAMQKNLELTEGAIAAEPLYLLLEKYGHTQAHEASKKLAHQALSEKKSLFDVASNSTEIKDYWQKLNADEKKIIQAPEKYYSGLAAEKTKQVIKNWQAYVKK